MHIRRTLAIGLFTCFLGHSAFGGNGGGDPIGLTLCSPFLTSTGASMCIAAKAKLEEEHRIAAGQLGLDYDTDIVQLRKGHLTEGMQQFLAKGEKEGCPESKSLPVICQGFKIKYKTTYTRAQIRSTTSAAVVPDA